MIQNQPPNALTFLCILYKNRNEAAKANLDLPLSRQSDVDAINRKATLLIAVDSAKKLTFASTIHRKTVCKTWQSVVDEDMPAPLGTTFINPNHACYGVLENLGASTTFISVQITHEFY